MKQYEFAKIVGCTQSHINGIVNGKKKCSPELALIFEEVTNGALNASELVFSQVKKKRKTKEKKKMVAE